MNLVLILLGIYVYFVVGNLVVKLLNHLVQKYGDRRAVETGKLVLILFPVAILTAIMIIIIDNRYKFNIPFTPKKVADFLCNIRIDKKVDLADKRLKVPMPVGKPKIECFGEYVSGNAQAERCCEDCDYEVNCILKTVGRK